MNNPHFVCSLHGRQYVRKERELLLNRPIAYACLARVPILVVRHDVIRLGAIDINIYDSHNCRMIKFLQDVNLISESIEPVRIDETLQCKYSLVCVSDVRDAEHPRLATLPSGASIGPLTVLCHLIPQFDCLLFRDLSRREYLCPTRQSTHTQADRFNDCDSTTCHHAVATSPHHIPPPAGRGDRLRRRSGGPGRRRSRGPTPSAASGRPQACRSRAGCASVPQSPCA